MTVSHKEIPLSSGKIAIVDAADYEALSRFKWFYLASKRKRTGYAYRTENHKTILMHRQLLGAQKGEQTDHRDGDGLNNRRENLRLCTHLQNQYNRAAPRKKKTSRFKGVHWLKRDNIWRSTIRAAGKVTCLGYFRDEEEAARAYDAAAIKHHGEFAWLNFPLAETIHT